MIVFSGPQFISQISDDDTAAFCDVGGADHPLLWGIDVTQCRFPNPAFATLTDSWEDTMKERYDREDFTYKTRHVRSESSTLNLQTLSSATSSQARISQSSSPVDYLEASHSS